jgi:hypothetical protein
MSFISARKAFFLVIRFLVRFRNIVVGCKRRWGFPELSNTEAFSKCTDRQSYNREKPDAEVVQDPE